MITSLDNQQFFTNDARATELQILQAINPILRSVSAYVYCIFKSSKVI